MGIGTSKAVDRLKHHPFFAAFTGKEKIHALNPQQQNKFWRELWAIPVDPWTIEPSDLMANLRVYADQLRDNSYETKNYASLILQVIGLLGDVSVTNQEQITLAIRAVFNLRIFTQSFIETTSADPMKLLFDVPNNFKQQNHLILRQYVNINNNPTQSNENSANSNENNTNIAQPENSVQEIEAADVPTEINLPWELLESIVNFLINKDFSYMTASLHEEVMKLLLTLLSTQMFQNSNGQHENMFLNLLFNVPQGQFLRTADLIETLLLHFVLQQQGVSHATASSIILTSLSYAASAFWKLPWNAYSLLVKRTIPEDLAHLLTAATPYADLALDLILILINYTPANVNTNTTFDTFHNPFKFALNTFVDDEFGLNKDLEADSTLANTTFKLSISRLYTAILNKIDDERTVLLLYFLLHGNNLFSSYVLSRTDIETMILPMLKVLYNVVEQKPQRVYIILITLLILTNDESFCAAAQTLSLKTVPWYKEKFLSNISLGGIITLVLLRTAQISVRQLRDNYLLSNCIACVANMAPHFEDLHPFAAFKLISTLQLLTKKHGRLLMQYSNYRNELMTKRAAENQSANPQEKKDGSDDVTLEEDEMLLNIESQVQQSEDVIALTLQVFNSTLKHKLQHNGHLIYQIVHQQQLFDSIYNQYLANQKFRNMLMNIQAIISYFVTTLGKTQSIIESSQTLPQTELATVEAPAWTVQQVLDTIKHASLIWKSDVLHPFAEMQFKYEEENPTEFFSPYIWNLIYHSKEFDWSPQRITLFNPHQSQFFTVFDDTLNM